MSRATRQRNRNPALVFAALGDEMRLELVRRLCERGPQSIAVLTQDSARTRQAVTKHLKVLERSGIARCTRQGRQSLWRIHRDPIDQARDDLERISAQWDAALDRLRRLVED